jgi:1,4-alpha-glucan branching enzyme
VPNVTSAFCLVLHAHQPYVRRHGAWPCGEDWYHQAATEAYLPVADTFAGLAADGLSGLATVSVTPVLASQMADPYLTRELLGYAGRTMLRAEAQVANYRGPWGAELRELAAFEHRRAAKLVERLEGPESGGTHLPWRTLAEGKVVETWTSAPTHAYLPGLRNEALMTAGLRAAAAEHRRVFGVEPEGLWLPECGYRPGLEDVLEAASLSASVLNGDALEGNRRAPALCGDSAVRLFARDTETSALVSGVGAFPGGPAYRDFHHYDEGAGFKSFAVTNEPGTPGPKRPYDPAGGEAAARGDAHRFAAEIERRLDAEPGVLVTAFDLELFGHWWFEGPAFLDELLRTLSASGSVRPMTLSAAAEAFPPRRGVHPEASSWGRDGDDSSWRNAATAPVWARINQGEELLEQTLGAGPDPRVAAQAIREQLLLSASDWPYMISMGRAADYARDRIDAHDAALKRLCAAAAEGRIPDELEALEEQDNLLPGLDPALFHPQPGAVRSAP